MKFLMPKIEERKKTSLVHQKLKKAWSLRTVLATTFGHAAKKVHIRKLQPYSTAIYTSPFLHAAHHVHIVSIAIYLKVYYYYYYYTMRAHRDN